MRSVLSEFLMRSAGSSSIPTIILRMNGQAFRRGRSRSSPPVNTPMTPKCIRKRPPPKDLNHFRTFSVGGSFIAGAGPLFLRIFSLLAGPIMADSSGRDFSDEAIQNVGKKGRGMSMVRGKIR